MSKIISIIFNNYLKIKFIDLLLILISAIIGISVLNHLSLPIDWINSIRSILCLVLFKIGIDLYKVLLNWREFSQLVDKMLFAETGKNRQIILNGIVILAITFFSISMIPYIQIVINKGAEIMPLFMIALINLSLLVVDQKRYQQLSPPIVELVFSFHLSLSIPMVMIGMSLDRTPSFLQLIVIPLFLFFLALKIMNKVKEIKEDEAAFNYLEISIPKILLIHNILIASGYFMWAVMGLFGLDMNIWIFPVLTTPIGIFSIYFAGKIMNGKSKDFDRAYLFTTLGCLSQLFGFVATLIRN